MGQGDWHPPEKKARRKGTVLRLFSRFDLTKQAEARHFLRTRSDFTEMAVETAFWSRPKISAEF